MAFIFMPNLDPTHEKGKPTSSEDLTQGTQHKTSELYHYSIEKNKNVTNQMEAII
jgi:hypothetical protein